ncbi:MAG TPA: zinc-dependent metalloprotease [Saprospiraceae bacterium]|nr:zinc-dependent metalloprotease [Saprospiraceae bacterium]HMQ81323.1 zinc-dependent metalloprotease [Saprospiraceae bacterium]
MRKIYLIISCYALLSKSFSQMPCQAPLINQHYNSTIEVEQVGGAYDYTIPRSPVTIPVIVHVVWYNASENISDAQIMSQIEVLNRDFNAENNETTNVPAIFDHLIANLEISFCLTAITRRQSNISGIGNQFTNDAGVSKRRVCYQHLGGHDAIDPMHYLNIWISGRSDGAAGDATYPDVIQSNPAEDGVFIAPEYVGTLGSVSMPYHLGRTLTHEIGHYFNLRHLWGDGSGNNLCQDDDGVNDTPKQQYTYFNECPTHPSFSCGSADMFMNFMNYTNDACMAMFSLGQQALINATLGGLRAGLLDGSCEPVSSFFEEEQEDFQILGNPTRNEIRLFIPEKDPLKIAIFDVSGRLVWEEKGSGDGIVHLNGCSLNAGLFFLILEYPEKIMTKKLIIAE